MTFPNDLRYTKDHEWVRPEDDEAVVGITEYAQGELGDIVFVDLPEIGRMLIQNQSFGTIEAVKAAADMFAPVSGEVVAVNGLLDHSPELINKSPYEDGWIIRIKMKDDQELDTLYEAAAYTKLIAKEKGD
ncbi:MAG: glycine cleavage system protein GcvH [Calditrichota bacterium]